MKQTYGKFPAPYADEHAGTWEQVRSEWATKVRKAVVSKIISPVAHVETSLKLLSTMHLVHVSTLDTGIWEKRG